MGTAKDQPIGERAKMREYLFVQLERECDEARRGGNGMFSLGRRHDSRHVVVLSRCGEIVGKALANFGYVEKKSFG